MTVAGGLRHGRIPRAEEISAKTQEVAGVGEVRCRQLLAAETECIGASQHIVTKQVVLDRTPCAETREELLYQRSAMTGAAGR